MEGMEGMAAQQPEGPGIVFWLVYLVGVAFAIYVGWRIFVKAGKPGWAVIVPIYNTIVALSIAGKPWWWLFLFFIPVVNIVMAILFLIAFAKAFGKSTLFGVGLIVPIVNVILLLMLAFGDTKYVGIGAAPAPAAA